jgi:hypothetical protein
MAPELLRPYLRYAGIPVLRFADEAFQFTPAMIFELRQLDYVSQWRKCLTNGWFHVLLEDQSMFSFSGQGANLSHSYMPCPLRIGSISEFVEELGIQPNTRTKQQFADDYQLAVETAELKTSITPLRYDLDRGAYRACVHPSAHLHIGLENEIRIALRREMSPLAFVLFVIRQVYPHAWEKLLEFRKQLFLERRIRDDLEEVANPHWMPDDEIQCYLY